MDSVGFILSPLGGQGSLRVFFPRHRTFFELPRSRGKTLKRAGPKQSMPRRWGGETWWNWVTSKHGWPWMAEYQERSLPVIKRGNGPPPFIDDVPIETSIYTGCSIATFDYQRVSSCMLVGLPCWFIPLLEREVMTEACETLGWARSKVPWLMVVSGY